MVSLLAEAEQQDLVDVFLVMVTHQGQVPQHRRGHPKAGRLHDAELEDQETTVDHWRRLDGSEPGRKQESLDTEKGDCILQVSSLVGLCPQVVYDFDVLLPEA